MSGLYTYRLCSFVLALGLGMGVVTLSVVSLNSRAIVLVEDDEDVDVLHARLGIAAGLSTAISIMIMPISIIFELVDAAAVYAAAWTVVVVMAAASSSDVTVCNSTNSYEQSICSDAGVIVGLSALLVVVLSLYLLVLLFVACTGAMHGTPIWTCPVRPDSRHRKSLRDVESTPGEQVEVKEGPGAPRVSPNA
ncbi:hypothetical protein ONZ51_g11828 [Trametes cubensis]|uniref:Uncharacterized protein n=1 Tax=Trametes cubensis TaxID=1111947 RepID=A0AAD7TGU3_9APHY|nr:hypothetical protein ONZ51_g11828 [Trametes cubensis]